MIHFIVPSFTSAKIGSEPLGWVSVFVSVEAVFVAGAVEGEEEGVGVEVDVEVGSRVTNKGEEAIARCAASFDSKIAMTGRCLFGE